MNTTETEIAENARENSGFSPGAIKGPNPLSTTPQRANKTPAATTEKATMNAVEIEPKARRKPAPAADSPLLNQPQVCTLLGVSRAALFRTLNADRSFPRGAKIGRNRVWLRSDLLAWVSAASKRN